jgi:two-component system chemotaxis response regulator CheY
MSLKILVVDDSGLARRTLRQMLLPQGHTVEEASDGAQAIERYFINRHDVVFLDMVMEGMYGLEVLTKIRALNPDVKVIVATADVQTSTREEVKAAGASAMVNKPISATEVTRILELIEQGGMAWS